MKLLNRYKIITGIIVLSIFSLNTWADKYQYNANVKGMVCAFCAYNVSKNISKLPGVNADSINVDLKGGHVSFSSEQKVSEQKLTTLFSNSGFTISDLNLQKNPTPKDEVSQKIQLELKIDIFQVDQLTTVIEAIGNIAANTDSRLIVKAPISQEDVILKPLLMGKQQVIKVRFIPVKSDEIILQLF